MKNALFILSGILIGAFAITIAKAQSNDIIHACVAQPGSNSQSQNLSGQGNAGSVRIVSSQSDCRNGETYLTWNVQGPPGPTGPTGASGPPGSSGNGAIVCDYCEVSDVLHRIGQSNLTNYNFDNAILNLTYFLNTDISGSSFKYAILYSSPIGYTNASDADFSNARLSGTMDIYNTNFTRAKFINTRMISSNVGFNNFTDADFTGADLSYSSFAGNDFTGAIWSNTTCPDGTNSNNHGNTCIGHKAN